MAVRTAPGRVRTDLVGLAEEAGRAGLVGADVSVLVREHGLEGARQGGHGDGVGGGAGGDETHLGVDVEQGADQVGGARAHRIGPIAGSEALVGVDDRLDRLRGGRGGVVGGEVVAGAHASVLAQARRSSTKRSGASIAAKWPPRGMSVQRTRS